MKALIIFALITLISYSNQSIDTKYSYECPDDKKVKIGDDVCAIASAVKGTTTNPYTYYIKKKSCGKNKYCTELGELYNKDTTLTDDDGEVIQDKFFICQKKVRLLKIKKKCSYNTECISGFCNDGKCATSDTCTTDDICGPSKYCLSGKCTDYIKDGEKVDMSLSQRCAPGLGVFNDPDDYTKATCKKYYSLDKGDKTSGPQFCKSYFSEESKCAELIEVDGVDSDCSYTYNIGGDNKVAKPGQYGTSSYYDTVDSKKYCIHSTGKKELVDELVKRYNKIKLDKLLEKESCDYGTYYLCDKKYAELKEVYDNYATLRYLNLIKDNGEKNKDKKCEYEFWRTITVSSSYVNVCFGFFFTLLSILF